MKRKHRNEIQVGQPAVFQIRVRNNGQTPADNVLIRDEIPEGTKFVDSTPEATTTADGASAVGNWNDQSLATNRAVTVQLMPESEGQIGSVATVSFQASATARAKATKPQLALEHSAPRQVMLGEKVKFSIKLSNPGSGTAKQVVLDENVPPGLKHSTGPKLTYEVGVVRPGQTRHLELSLTANEPGVVENTLVARGEGGLLVKDTIKLEVISPRLQVGVKGPSKRYLERDATFTVNVANPGTAAARNVELVTMLPRGLKFLSTNNSGHYDQARHAIVWSLETLPAGEMGRAQFKARPIEMGQHIVKAQAKADRDLKSSQEHKLLVEGIAALYFGIVDQTDPIEVGGRTTYVLTVENQGSQAASNVRFVAELPTGMKPINGERGTIRDQRIFFEPIARLAPKAKTSFRIVVQGLTQGDHKIRVEMNSDDISSPVIKEESTRVYTD